MSCPTQEPYPSFDRDEPVPRIGEGEFGGVLVSTGVFSTMEPSPTSEPTTTSEPDEPPLPTFAPGEGNPYCFRDHNEDGLYRPIPDEVGIDSIERLCGVADALNPTNTFGHALRGPDDLLVAVTWANSQDGCPPQQDVPLRDWCVDTFKTLILACDNPDDAYGGAFVEKNDGYGCVEWWLGTSALSSSTKRIKAREGEEPWHEVTDGQELAEVAEMLARVEPTLPRLARAPPGLQGR